MGIFGKFRKKKEKASVQASKESKPPSRKTIPELIKDLGDGKEQAQARSELVGRGLLEGALRGAPEVVSALVEAFGYEDEEVGKQAQEALKGIVDRLIDPSNIYPPTREHFAYRASTMPDMVEALVKALGDIHKAWSAYLTLKYIYEETETRLPRGHRLLTEVWNEVGGFPFGPLHGLFSDDEVKKVQLNKFQADMKKIIPEFKRKWRSLWMGG